jgi:hypothetical protein
MVGNDDVGMCLAPDLDTAGIDSGRAFALAFPGVGSGRRVGDSLRLPLIFALFVPFTLVDTGCA